MVNNLKKIGYYKNKRLNVLINKEDYELRVTRILSIIYIKFAITIANIALILRL